MVFGISIGSSTVCSAVCQSGRVQVVANMAGEHRPRAIVAKTESDLVVGTAAMNARNTPIFKNILRNFEENGPVHMMQQQGQSVRVDVLLGALIEETVETCKNAKSDSSSVVISVPDEWDDQKVSDFTKIFEKVSNFSVLRTIRRSTAAWLAILQNDNIDEIENLENQEKKEILVIRVGGDSATGTLLYEERGLVTLGKTHRTNGGADLIVEALKKTLIGEANRKFRVDISESKRAILKVENEARRAIEVLSNKDTVSIQIESCFEGMDFQTNTNRGRLHGTAPYKDILSQIFEQFKNTQPAQVIICGGGAKSPKIQSLIKSEYGESVVKIVSNVESLICVGCAIQCHIIHSSPKLSISEIPKRIPFSPIQIQSKSEDETKVLVAKGTPLPLSFNTNETCEIFSPELGNDCLVSVVGHTTGIFNEKGLFIKNAENSFDLLF